MSGEQTKTEEKAPEAQSKAKLILLSLHSQGQEKAATFVHDVDPKTKERKHTGSYKKLSYATYKVTDGAGVMEAGVEVRISGVKPSVAVPPSIVIAWE